MSFLHEGNAGTHMRLWCVQCSQSAFCIVMCKVAYVTVTLPSRYRSGVLVLFQELDLYLYRKYLNNYALSVGYILGAIGVGCKQEMCDLNKRSVWNN
jgi:hypothetical protein